MRTIAHVDLDAFYVSVELQRRPDLRGRPVVVSGRGPRAVVTTASYEARRFGVGSAMPTAQARRLCPQAVVIPPDFAAYRAVSGTVMDLVRGAADAVEVAGLDEAYLDLTGRVAPHAAMRRLIAEIRAATGLGCSVGIGPNKLVAKVASDAEKPLGFVVLSQDQACARFGGAPVTLVPGIGGKTAAALAALGIETLAGLAAAPPASLAERFGPRLGPWLADRARFVDDSPVQPVRIAVSESRERTFDADISDRAELERIVAGLAGDLAGALAAEGRAGRTVGIKVRLDDFSTFTRAKTLPEPVRDGPALAGLAVGLLRDFAPARPVRLLGVRVAGFDAARSDAGQLELPV